LDRQPGRELAEQRADPLPAERIDVALGGFGEIRRRYLAQRLGAAEWSEHELHGRAPLAEILRQRLRAGDVGPAVSRIVDGAIAAHEARQKILHFAFARIAQPDPQPLTRRRRIDIEPGPDRELRHRIEVGHVDPMRAAVVGSAEGAHVGEAAPAHAVARFQERESTAGRHDATRGRDAGSPGAHDDDVDVG